MDTTLAGIAIGIPLAAASAAIAWFVVRAMLQSSDKPGISPALIPLALLSGIGMLLYAGNSELTELAGIASVGIGAMATYLAHQAAVTTTNDSHPVAIDQVLDEEGPELTAPVDGAEGIAPEDATVPEDIEALGNDENA